MDTTDLSKKLDELIKSITDRNKEVQTKKEDGGVWGYVTAIVLALISFITMAYAAYLANKQAKELAATRTELEKFKVDLAQKDHEAQVTKERDKQENLAAEARLLAIIIADRDKKLKALETEHAERQKKLEGLKAWEEINDA